MFGRAPRFVLSMRAFSSEGKWSLHGLDEQRFAHHVEQLLLPMKNNYANASELEPRSPAPRNTNLRVPACCPTMTGGIWC